MAQICYDIFFGLQSWIIGSLVIPAIALIQTNIQQAHLYTIQFVQGRLDCSSVLNDVTSPTEKCIPNFRIIVGVLRHCHSTSSDICTVMTHFPSAPTYPNVIP